jgi:cation diffusion facilitator CzcD-associated flavoprotein CzcO
MLQRSPTYIVSAPEQDRVANLLRRILPARWAYRLARWKNVGWMMYFYQLSQRFPDYTRKQLLKLVRQELGEDYDVATHFTPRYRPWEQRLCLVPDADLFQAIKAGRASVVTDQIETFTERGIRLQSGRELEADIIVTATGLAMQPLGGMELSVDGRRVDVGETLAYRGILLSDVPNLASVFGYINASWTLKADLICAYVCRLLNHMDARGARQVTPRRRGEKAEALFVERFSAGYMQRALGEWPKQGAHAPWRVRQNYLRDAIELKWARLDDGVLEYAAPRPASTSREAGELAEAAR